MGSCCGRPEECENGDSLPKVKILVRTNSGSLAETYTDGSNDWDYDTGNSVGVTYKIHQSGSTARITRVSQSCLTVSEDSNGVLKQPYFTTHQENQRGSFPYYHQSFDYNGSDEKFTLSFQTIKQPRTTIYLKISEGDEFGGITTTTEAPPSGQYEFEYQNTD